MNNLDLLYDMVGPEKEVLRLLALIVKGSKYHLPRMLFVDLDNVVFRTDEILTEKWLPKTIWRRFIRKDVTEAKVDEFFYDPEDIGIPKKMVNLFRLSILGSITKLTREMRKMSRDGEKVAIDGITEAVREIRDMGVWVVFLTNRPRKVCKETKKQVEIVFGKDDKNIVLHMRRGFNKADVVNYFDPYSIGLVDDKSYNLIELNDGYHLAIFFTNGEDFTNEHKVFAKVAKKADEIPKLVAQHIRLG